MRREGRGTGHGGEIGYRAMAKKSDGGQGTHLGNLGKRHLQCIPLPVQRTVGVRVSERRGDGLYRRNKMGEDGEGRRPAGAARSLHRSGGWVRIKQPLRQPSDEGLLSQCCKYLLPAVAVNVPTMFRQPRKEISCNRPFYLVKPIMGPVQPD